MAGALRWFSRAAEQELAAAQYNLVICTVTVRACQLTMPAAIYMAKPRLNGLAAARNELGIAYESGYWCPEKCG